MGVSELVRGSVQRRGKLSFIFVVIIQKWLFFFVLNAGYSDGRNFCLYTRVHREREKGKRERGCMATSEHHFNFHSNSYGTCTILLLRSWIPFQS